LRSVWRIESSSSRDERRPNLLNCIQSQGSTRFLLVEDPLVEAGIPGWLVPPPASILELFICGPHLLPVPCTYGPPMWAVGLNGWKEKRCQNLRAPRPACISSSQLGSP